MHWFTRNYTQLTNNSDLSSSHRQPILDMFHSHVQIKECHEVFVPRYYKIEIGNRSVPPYARRTLPVLRKKPRKLFLFLVPSINVFLCHYKLPFVRLHIQILVYLGTKTRFSVNVFCPKLLITSFSIQCFDPNVACENISRLHIS